MCPHRWFFSSTGSAVGPKYRRMGLGCKNRCFSSHDGVSPPGREAGPSTFHKTWDADHKTYGWGFVESVYFHLKLFAGSSLNKKMMFEALRKIDSFKNKDLCINGTSWKDIYNSLVQLETESAKRIQGLVSRAFLKNTEGRGIRRESGCWLEQSGRATPPPLHIGPPSSNGGK